MATPALEGFHLDVAHVTSACISLVREGHMAMPYFKGYEEEV